ncbi:TlpA disulfide reductase family protein [Prosthecobacter sp.]|uniref:TlpA family protein disulfide reductase n=1 Tax=Prosthecobacter sp. TaxID=1965333 RepID=UPI0024893E56|nr:TlpA disulfide reductase family protein [Prosthecobacter sp.]MDI1312911.1 TlpA disulfide reductase family protein [Prosthecobacter sp.]
MNAKLLITALLMVGGSSHASELHWQNGEWVGGHFVGAENGHVIWRTPMFSEDFQVSMDVLKRVNRHKTDAKTEEAFSIRLADGSRLFGTVTGLDEKTLSVKSARFGSIQVLRDSVVSVQRLKAKGMPFPALAGTSGWTEIPAENNQSAPVKEKLWRMVPGAALQQVGWNHRVSLPLESPELVEMQFTLSSTVRPEFKIELKASDDDRVIVETWVDDVVLQGRVFESAQKLSNDVRRVTLTLFWNRQTGLCSIYGADGKKLAQTTKPPVDAAEPEAKAEEKKADAPAGGGGLFGALLGVVQDAVQGRVDAVAQAKADAADRAAEASPTGLTLLNKGPDLTLEALRVREWDGSLPEDLTDVRPRIELTDGRYLKAKAVRADATSLTVRALDGKEASLPWDKVLAVEMTHEASPFYQAAQPLTEMWFTDGEWINGTLVQVRNEVATFNTTFSTTPVNFKITTLHHLQFKGFETTEQKIDLATLDTLTINKNLLHGTLAADGETQPLWKPFGALKPVAMTSTGEMEITRAVADKPAGMRSEALFYLHDGDVVPGRLRAIDAKHVDLESDVSALKQLPSEKLQAIQFVGASLNLDGFEDPGWQRVRGKAEQVKRNGKAGIDFTTGGSWGHPAFMQVNEINFTLLNNGFSALRMRLFCDGINPAAPSTNLLFGHMGSEVCFGLEAANEQMDRQFRLRTSASMPVRIAIAENTLEVFFNGVSARKIPLTPKMRSGSGIIIEPFSLWGNGERAVKINAFSARIAPGRVAVPLVDARAKEHALTVPRFRKEDPPRHALLAANGDLLRGVIEAATAQHFAIRSGMETIQVPRDRVKAAVWLIKPADAVSAAFVAQDNEDMPPVITHWLLLNNGGRLGLKVERFANDAVFGTSPLLGSCRVPLSQIYVIRTSSPPDSATMLALREWKLKFAPEPVLPESGGQSSPLLNQDAKPFKLPLLAGGDFDLGKEKGKVIVLDFWATWCGPCIKSLPQMMDEMAAFDSNKVRFIGINQAEDKETVKTFLETRGWKFEVALDANQRVGQNFGVEGIPHTVVIGPDGKVAYVKSGYEPGGAKEVAEMVKKLLAK